MSLFLENEINRVLCDVKVGVSITVEGTIQSSDIKLLWLKGLNVKTSLLHVCLCCPKSEENILLQSCDKFILNFFECRLCLFDVHGGSKLLFLCPPSI